MKCHMLFSGKSKRNISICFLLKILPRVLPIRVFKKSYYPDLLLDYVGLLVDIGP